MPSVVVKNPAKAAKLKAKAIGAYPKQASQVLDIQEALHFAALQLKEDLSHCSDREERARTASALASVAKGWQGATDTRRVLAGKPMPGSLRPEAPKKQRKAKLTPVEAVQEEPSQPTPDRTTTTEEASSS